MLSFEGKSEFFAHFLSFFRDFYQIKAAPTLSFWTKMALSFCAEAQKLRVFWQLSFRKNVEKISLS